jgi:hypothetical protein
VASTVALPGTPANDRQVLVTNVGSLPVALNLGAVNPVAVTEQTGLVVLPGQSRAIGIAAAQAFIGGIAIGAIGTQCAIVSMTTGN